MIVNATLDTVNGRPTLRFERRLPHPPEKVWRAITDPAELAHWFPQNLDGTFAPGAKLRFVFRGEPPVLDGKVIEDFTGEVLEIDPPRVLAYTWGDDILRWTLTPVTDGCLLTFTDTLSDQGKAARDGAGTCAWKASRRGWPASAARPTTGGRKCTRVTSRPSARRQPPRRCPASCRFAAGRPGGRRRPAGLAPLRGPAGAADSTSQRRMVSFPGAAVRRQCEGPGKFL